MTKAKQWAVLNAALAAGKLQQFAAASGVKLSVAADGGIDLNYDWLDLRIDGGMPKSIRARLSIEEVHGLALWIREMFEVEAAHPFVMVTKIKLCDALRKVLPGPATVSAGAILADLAKELGL